MSTDTHPNVFKQELDAAIREAHGAIDVIVKRLEACLEKYQQAPVETPVATPVEPTVEPTQPAVVDSVETPAAVETEVPSTPEAVETVTAPPVQEAVKSTATAKESPKTSSK